MLKKRCFVQFTQQVPVMGVVATNYPEKELSPFWAGLLSNIGIAHVRVETTIQLGQRQYRLETIEIVVPNLDAGLRLITFLKSYDIHATFETEMVQTNNRN